MRRLFVIAIECVLLMTLAVGCLEAPSRPSYDNPGDPMNPANQIPDPPSNVRAVVDENSCSLHWDLFDGAADYRVYSLSGREYVLLAEVDDPGDFYPVEDLMPQTEYSFFVTSVSPDGYESEPSLPVKAVPNHYLIDLGTSQGIVGTAEVDVDANVPAGTVGFRYSEDSASLDDLPWRAFSSRAVLRFDPIQGMKIFYVEFLDELDFRSSILVDSLYYDGFAEIESVDFFTEGGGDTAYIGEEILFTLTPNPGYEYEESLSWGETTIRIGSESNPLREFSLNDQGIEGDEAAGDGIYSYIYLVRIEDRCAEQYIYGNFTDYVGNQALEQSVDHLLTILE